MELAAPLLCAGITVYSPMKRHKMDQPGKSLGVVGLGGLGHMAVKFGKAFGLHVTVLSTSESKRDEALTLLEADRFVISSDKEQMKVRKLHKDVIKSLGFIYLYECVVLFDHQDISKSLDFIIDTASGDHPFDPYMSLLKIGGVLVLVGAPSEVKLSPGSLLWGKLTLEFNFMSMKVLKYDWLTI